MFPQPKAEAVGPESVHLMFELCIWMLKLWILMFDAWIWMFELDIGVWIQVVCELIRFVLSSNTLDR